MRTTKKASAPLTITITGELADQIRALAKEQRATPAAIAKTHLRFGLLTTDPSEEGQQFRREIAEGRVPMGMLDELGDELSERVLAEATARGMTPSRFIESVIGEVLTA